MFDYLRDIVQHTFGLGVIEVIKVTGTKDKTKIETIASERTVIVQAESHVAIPEFIGQFGMPSLNKLNVILGIPEYEKDAKITVTKKKEDDGTEVPSGLHFENKAGDFKNDYRFMSSALINEQLKTIKFNGVSKWNVEFTPTAQNIQRMRFMTSANSDEVTFIAKTEKNLLKFYFGDHSTHAGNFVFADGIAGTLTKNYLWPVAVVNGILGLTGDKTFKISDEGAAQITVDSGLITYNYILPAQQK